MRNQTKFEGRKRQEEILKRSNESPYDWKEHFDAWTKKDSSFWVESNLFPPFIFIVMVDFCFSRCEGKSSKERCLVVWTRVGMVEHVDRSAIVLSFDDSLQSSGRLVWRCAKTTRSNQCEKWSTTRIKQPNKIIRGTRKKVFGQVATLVACLTIRSAQLTAVVFNSTTTTTTTHNNNTRNILLLGWKSSGFFCGKARRDLNEI